jgi:CheY-like chemotaxis protein
MRPGILVIDDAATIRALLCQFLERAGFRVWTAGEGPDAVDLYEQHHNEIDVVLLEADLGLCPNSLEILEQLRRINPTLRCCFMNSNPWLYDEADLLARGAEWVFPKPFTAPDVASVLREMAGSAPRQPDLAATLRNPN